MRELLDLIAKKYISPSAYWELHKNHSGRVRITTVNLEIFLALLSDPGPLCNNEACTIDSGILEKVIQRIYPGQFERLTGSEIVRESPLYTDRRSIMLVGASHVARSTARDKYVELGTPKDQVLIADEPSKMKKVEMDNLLPQRVGFFAYGHPKQEQKIQEFIDLFPHETPILIGVGGAIDYFANLVPRPPALLERHGLEWLWRLILQPRTRLRRIAKVVPLAFRLLSLSRRYRAQLK